MHNISIQIMIDCLTLYVVLAKSWCIANNMTLCFDCILNALEIITLIFWQTIDLHVVRYSRRVSACVVAASVLLRELTTAMKH